MAFIIIYTTPQGGGSARPFFHLSVVRWDSGSVCTVLPLNTRTTNTCLLSSPLSSMVPRSLGQFICCHFLSTKLVAQPKLSVVADNVIPGPRFGSILFLTLSWNECLVWRTVHKYERFLAISMVF
jgi:hypothetical protein